MDTKWKNMVKAIKKFIKEYYDCVFGALMFIIGSFLFFVMLVNRYYFSTWGVWRICLIGNILVQPGICLLVRRYMKLRYRNWSQKGSAETYLQDTEDSIYYQTWKAKEKQSEKRFRNILAVELSAAAAYLFFISYSSRWGWNYAAGYMMVATVFIEYICCREVIQRYWRNELDQIMEQTDLQKMVDQIAVNIPVFYEEKQKLLEAVDLTERFEQLSVLLENEIQVMNIKTEIQEKVKARVDKNQREYILREQLKVIREELGEDTTGAEADHFQEEADKLEASDEVKERIEKEIERVEHTNVGTTEAVQALLESYESTPLTSGTTLAELIRRPELSYEKIAPIDKHREELPYDVKEQVDINIKYDGYIKRQMRQVEQFKKLENKRIPENINYDEIQSLRLEAKQKLNQIRPSSIGQASRISGVSPADVSVLLVYLSSK